LFKISMERRFVHFSSFSRISQQWCKVKDLPTLPPSYFSKK
jgi:hypothetical protein